MKSFRLDRRTLLRGAGGVAIGMPLLEAMLPTRSAHAAAPQRLVVFFTPNGTIHKNWVPSGSGASMSLPRILKPLETLKNKMVFIDGLRMGDAQGRINGPGNDHQRGMGYCLTGQQLLTGTFKGDEFAEPAGLAKGISIDQHIANKIGGSTRFKSLEFGVRSLTVAGNPLFHMSYTGSGNAIQPEQNSLRMFQRVFGGMTAKPPAGAADAAKLAQDQTSVLDFVKSSYSDLTPRLGKTDREKLDNHLAHIRDLEKRLAALPGGGGAMMSASCGSTSALSPQDACGKPTCPDDFPYHAEYFQAGGDAQLRLMQLALACDQTRVASIQWSYSSGGGSFPWLGIDRGHHDISHDSVSNAASQEQLTKINEWYAQKFFTLVSGMDKVQEEGGTMLDNSLVIWVNELAEGSAHTLKPQCYVVAGKAGGKLQTGRALHIDDEHNNLLVSIMNLMGVQGNTFGDARWCHGPLKGFTA